MFYFCKQIEATISKTNEKRTKYYVYLIFENVENFQFGYKNRTVVFTL